MADTFKEVLPSIYSTKKSVYDSNAGYESYPAFMVNRALSYQVDCIFFANAMNINYHLDKKMQYAFYLGTIRKGKRPFVKWAQKPTQSKPNLEAVQRYYAFSRTKAEEALKTLTQEQIDEIIVLSETGGKTK